MESLDTRTLHDLNDVPAELNLKAAYFPVYQSLFEKFIANGKNKFAKIKFGEIDLRKLEVSNLSFVECTFKKILWDINQFIYFSLSGFPLAKIEFPVKDENQLMKACNESDWHAVNHIMIHNIPDNH